MQRLSRSVGEGQDESRAPAVVALLAAVLEGSPTNRQTFAQLQGAKYIPPCSTHQPGSVSMMATLRELVLCPVCLMEIALNSIRLCDCVSICACWWHKRKCTPNLVIESCTRLRRQKLMNVHR